MSEGYDRVTISARVPEPLRDELDEWVEGSDHGNRGAAIQALIEEHLSDTQPTLEEPDDDHRPEQPHLDAVYQAALDATGHAHELDDEQLSALATSVNNDPDSGISPDAEAVETYLRDLEARNFVARGFDGANMRGEGGRLVWHIKPLEAVPDQWSMSRENRARLENRSQRLRHLRAVCQAGVPPEKLRTKFERYLGQVPEKDADLYLLANVDPPEDVSTEDQTPIDTTAWLTEQRAAADGGERP